MSATSPEARSLTTDREISKCPGLPVLGRVPERVLAFREALYALAANGARSGFGHNVSRRLPVRTQVNYRGTFYESLWAVATVVGVAGFVSTMSTNVSSSTEVTSAARDCASSKDICPKVTTTSVPSVVCQT